MRILRAAVCCAALLALGAWAQEGTDAGELEAQSGSEPLLNSHQQEMAAAVGHYFRDRFYDLLDIVDVSVGAGPGFLVNVHATKLAQAGLGYSRMYQAGMRGRSFGVWKEDRKEIGISLLYYQKVSREKISGRVESFRSDKMDLDTSAVYANNNDRAFTGIGVEVQALVGVNVNIRPAQIADFVLGWLTIDVLDDDNGKLTRNKDL